jgi:hypothetical protein
LDALAPESGAPATAPPAGAPRRGWLRAALPHAITAVVAVAAGLALQWLLPSAAPLPAPAPTSAPTATPPPPTPTARPAPSPPPSSPLSQGITQQELADIRAEGDQKQAQIYLLLAIVQIDDAEAALRANDLASVERSLVAIDSSLALAYARYERAGDSARDAVAQRRSDAGKMHDDLYLRPEGMDARLSQMRQLILALITEERR